jgi:hypothetical protein
MVIGSGGWLVYRDYFPGSLPILHARGTLQVDGRLTIGWGSGISGVPQTLRLEDASATDPARLLVSTGGTLELLGGQPGSWGNPPWLSVVEGDGSHGAAVEIHGTVAASYAAFRGLGLAGLQMLSGSAVGAAPLDLRNCWFDDGAPVPGSTLLTIARTAPTRLEGATFEATNSAATHAVRATTPRAVDVRNATGVLGNESFEDDPLAVISWTDGVSWFGAATPGCRGLAETRTSSAPHVGNATFTLRCTNGNPGGAGLLLLGTGALTTPLPLFGVDVWLDPGHPFVSYFVMADALGGFSVPQSIPNNPRLVGLLLWAQTLILEPTACRPLGLSGSTAIHYEVLP